MTFRRPERSSHGFRTPQEPMELAEEEIPIIILPDEVDIAAEFAPEITAAYPAEEDTQIVDLPPARQPVEYSEQALEEARGFLDGLVPPEAPPGMVDSLLSFEEVEAQINEELLLDKAGKRRIFSMPLLCRAAAIVVVSLLGLTVCIGWQYYRLPPMTRPLHHLHAVFRPSGTLGLSLGVAGLAAMLSSLTYVVRKAAVTRRRVGPLQIWMGFHILTGMLGPAIAVVHAAFLPTSAFGLMAIASMIVVVISGIVGRYIAVYFPRSLEGSELKFEEVRRRLFVYRRKLAELGVDPALLRIDDPQAKPRAPWLVFSLVGVFYGDWESRREYRRLKEIIGSRKHLRIEMEMILFLLRRLCWERQWLVRYGEFRKIVGSWRFLHRWLAIVLFVAIAYHVVVGTRFGRLWILGGRVG
ncbi:MAG TPA: hypothetical protein VFD71_03855 [Planctomycetota bacterium]|jgi:hypothetical protein|nr:hypothetical protein [Planctomycetota bacterium]